MSFGQSFQSTFRLLVVFSFLTTHFSAAQDGNYNSTQPDAKGTLNGGTGTAGSRDLSAVYYNPGIVALFETSNLGLNGNLYAYDYVRISDPNTDTDLKGSNVLISPSLFAGTFKWKDKSNFTTSYAVFNKGFYNNRITGFAQDEIITQTGNWLKTSSYDVRTRYSEDWIGMGVSYRMNEHLGIGIMPYVHMYTQQYLQRSNFQISPAARPQTVEADVSDYREARLFSSGLLFNFGIVYSAQNQEFGLSIVSPRINLTPFSWSFVERISTQYNASDTATASTLYDSDFLAKVKRPLEVNFGYARKQNGRVLRLRLSYYAPIRSYVMGKESSESYRSGFFKQADAYGHLPVSSARSVFNLGVGYEWQVKPNLTMVTGFRSDFSFFEKGRYLYKDFTTYFVYWNMYHVSCGVDWTHKWLRLNAGVDYGFSFQDNLPQFVNFNELDLPIDQVSLSPTASVLYQQVKIFLGVVVSFQ